VMTEPSYRQLTEQGLRFEIVYRRQGLWATSGQALMGARERPTVFLIVAPPPIGSASTSSP